MSKDTSAGLAVRVAPGAKRDAVECALDGSVKVRLRARAVEGKANAALTGFLAERLGVPSRAVTIRVGEHSRNKVVLVEGLSSAEALERLRAREA